MNESKTTSEGELPENTMTKKSLKKLKVTTCTKTNTLFLGGSIIETPRVRVFCSEEFYMGEDSIVGVGSNKLKTHLNLVHISSM